MFGSSSLRLAAIFTAGFAVAVALLGLVTLLATRAALTHQFDTRMRAEMAAVAADYTEGGLPGLLAEIDERRNNPGELIFGVQTAAGEPIKGPLAPLHPPIGWSTVRFPVHGVVRPVRLLTQDLPGGRRLIVGDDLEPLNALSGSVQQAFAVALAGVVLIGAMAGLALSGAMHRRMLAISGTAEAIIDGDLARRVPVSKGGDDLSQLALTLNRMLDRIGLLMDSLRQVSSDVAHDLRTPLTRLRQRLELSLRQAQDPGHRTQIEGALRDVDAILATFTALLRIAEVDAGARRAAFRPLDLNALARTVVDDFAPAAEDAGQSLVFASEGAAQIEGDPDLLTQMIVNLVENALRHTPRGSHIQVRLATPARMIELSVVDDGPGVPAAERERLFDRFYRLERSRSTAGNGLGLSLVAAVARLHRAEVRLDDADPGLAVRVTFAAGALAQSAGRS